MNIQDPMKTYTPPDFSTWGRKNLEKFAKESITALTSQALDIRGLLDANRKLIIELEEVKTKKA